jgi:hypothetical protein
VQPDHGSMWYYREQKTRLLCGICSPMHLPATTDRTLVMSRGKRFESARRLPMSACKIKVKQGTSACRISGFFCSP